MSRWWAVAALAALGCGKGKPVQPVVDPGVQAWAPAPSEVVYTRVTLAGPLPLPDTRLRETWAGPSLDAGRVVYDVTTDDVTDPSAPARVEGVRVYYDAGGMGFLGTFDADGAFTPWEPAQLVLPADPKVGASWSGEHRKGEVVSKRSCEILASDYCEGGLVVVCDSRRETGGVVVLRDHFCPDVGWSGFEALAQTGGGRPALRMWSEALGRDGAPVPFTYVVEDALPAEDAVPPADAVEDAAPPDGVGDPARPIPGRTEPTE